MSAFLSSVNQGQKADGVRALKLPFDAPKSLALNEVRIKHLESIGIGEWAKGKSVLDVGCGVGYFSRWFHDRGAWVTAIDPRRELLHEANERHGGEICWTQHTMGKGIDIEFVIGQFDLVLCYGLLYHSENPVGLLRELKALVKPAGYLLLESIVCDSVRPVALLTRESPTFADQGVSDLSMCPSPSFIQDGLYSVGFGWNQELATNFRSEGNRFDWIPQGHGNSVDEKGAQLRAIFMAGSKPYGGL